MHKWHKNHGHLATKEHRRKNGTKLVSASLDEPGVVVKNTPYDTEELKRMSREQVLFS